MAKRTLYTRRDCCLCDEMKAAIREVAEAISIELEEIDVDRSVELQKNFGDKVPLLFINGRKAFKYRVTAAELARSLKQKPRPLLRHWFGPARKESQ